VLQVVCDNNRGVFLVEMSQTELEILDIKLLDRKPSFFESAQFFQWPALQDFQARNGVHSKS
jgi:hypothetical protein